jgi:hypothetical protein
MGDINSLEKILELYEDTKLKSTAESIKYFGMISPFLSITPFYEKPSDAVIGLTLGACVIGVGYIIESINSTKAHHRSQIDFNNNGKYKLFEDYKKTIGSGDCFMR